MLTNHTEGDRVVYIAKGHPTRKVGQIGTVAGGFPHAEMVPVDWDDGQNSFAHKEAIMDFHRLKALFKRGPKIRKRKIA